MYIQEVQCHEIKGTVSRDFLAKRNNVKRLSGLKGQRHEIKGTVSRDCLAERDSVKILSN